MKLKKTLIAATLLLSITSAQAALVATDWKTQGDALSTLDEQTGIEWLDLTETVGMSYSQISGMFGNGGQFGGWRFPTATEIFSLYDNQFAGIDSASVAINNSYQVGVLGASKTLDFLSLIGITGNYEGGSNLVSSGMYMYDGNYLHAAAQYYNNTTYFYMNRNVNASTTDIHAFRGVYLVSDGGTTLSSQQDPSINANNANAPTSDVSAPALLGLMGLGLFGLASLRRRSPTTLKK